MRGLLALGRLTLNLSTRQHPEIIFDQRWSSCSSLFTGTTWPLFLERQFFLVNFLRIVRSCSRTLLGVPFADPGLYFLLVWVGLGKQLLFDNHLRVVVCHAGFQCGIRPTHRPCDHHLSEFGVRRQLTPISRTSFRWGLQTPQFLR